MKICNKCHIEKELIDFSIAKGNKDDYNNRCKKCVCEYVKEHTNINKEKFSKQRKQYREINKEKLKQIIYITSSTKTCSVCKINKHISNFNKNSSSIDMHKASCKKCQSINGSVYRLKNIDKIKKYRNDNKDILNSKKIKKKLDNIQYKLQCNLRTRLHSAIKGKYKAGSAVSDLGCSVSDFKIYIEKQFIKGMSWSNWGRDTWHLDHKKPLASFDLTNREEFLMAVNYKNIQPMWANDNLRKGYSIVHA